MFREKKKLNTTSFDLTFYQENTQILVNEQKKNLQILQDVVKKNALVKVLKGQTGGSLWKSS